MFCDIRLLIICSSILTVPIYSVQFICNLYNILARVEILARVYHRLSHSVALVEHRLLIYICFIRGVLR